MTFRPAQRRDGAYLGGAVQSGCAMSDNLALCEFGPLEFLSGSAEDD